MSGIPAIRSLLRPSDHTCLYFCKCMPCRLSGKVPPCKGCDRNESMMEEAEMRARDFLYEYNNAVREVGEEHHLDPPHCFTRCEAKRIFLEAIPDKGTYQQTRHHGIFTESGARNKETLTTHCPECYPWKLHALDIINSFKIILRDRKIKEERRIWRVEMRRLDCTSEARSIQYSRECSICMLETPRTRVAYVKCGHITCVICAEENEELNQISVCPFCRAESGYVKLFETVIEDSPIKEEGEPSNSMERSGGSASKRKASVDEEPLPHCHKPKKFKT